MPPTIPVIRLRTWFRRATAASAHLLVGAWTSVLALLGMIALASSLVLIGLPFAPMVLDQLRRLANWERERAALRLGVRLPRRPPLSGPRRWAARLGAGLQERATWREISWLVLHGLLGYLLAAVTFVLWVMVAASWLSFPAYLVVSANLPDEQFAYQGIPIEGTVAAVVVPLLGTVVAALLLLVLVPLLADFQARSAVRILSPSHDVALDRRVEQLTRTRAEALDAHAAELRRIERDLHDGVQAHLTSVAIRIGLLEQHVTSDPYGAELATEARVAAEGAIAELRHVVRTIYPPILADKGLAGAVAALAAQCPVEVELATAQIPPLPAAVEAAAYHVLAESLTNVTRHSGASTCQVTVSVHGGSLYVAVRDDGDGGAQPSLNSGLSGLHGRVNALDGTLSITSPAGGPTMIEAELPLSYPTTSEVSPDA